MKQVNNLFIDSFNHHQCRLIEMSARHEDDGPHEPRNQKDYSKNEGRKL